MAVARAQGQSGISAIHLWLIVFVALWLTSTVLLVILYLDQEKHKNNVAELQERVDKVISSQGKSLPQYTVAKPGQGTTAVDLLETARADTAELVSGNRADDVASLRAALEAKLESIRGNQYAEDPLVFEGVSYDAALDSMFELFRSKAEAYAEAETGMASRTAELEALRAAQTSQKEEFDRQAEGLKGQLAVIETERDQFLRDHEEQIASFADQIEQIQQQCSDDIQSQRGESARLRREYEELFARYQELKDKLGQSQVSPLPLATARGGDGLIVTAKPGDDVVYINLGAEDHLTLGLEFAVYDSLTGIPEDGRAKARIAVVHINERSAECSIVETLSNEMVTAGDFIANPIYDRHRTLKFFVLGEFDLDGDGRGDRDGQQRIESIVKDWGGAVERELSAQVDFVVLGGPPRRPHRSSDLDLEEDRGYQAAKRAYDAYQAQLTNVEVLAIPTLTQSVLLNFLGYSQGLPLTIGAAGVASPP